MYKKVISKDIESKEDEPKLPEFKNSGDHAAFNKALRGLTENMKLMRPKAFQKILVIGCSDEDYNKCNKSCKALKKRRKRRRILVPEAHHQTIAMCWACLKTSWRMKI